MASTIDLGPKSVVIVGSGLVGCLHGIYLRKHGYKVAFFESRADPRVVNETGRSINLVITSRGIQALTGLSDELAEKVMSVTTRVDGRTIHNADKSVVYQAYGPTSAYCNFSVSRWELNKVLIDAASDAGCEFFFSHPLAHVDIPNSTLFFYLQDEVTKGFYQKSVKASLVFGADGGGSRCRLALKGLLGDDCSDVCQPLGSGYKELSMPAGKDSSYLLHGESLHIWPRGTHFLMALANLDGSFTMTFYMSNDELAALQTEEQVEAFFTEHYPTAIALMPDYKKEFMSRPSGFLGTVFAKPWVFEDKLALIGDAAHAITPFFGQGCNCGFEDVSVFDEILTRHEQAGEVNMTAVLREYDESRKPNGDAIGNMALDNFVEMMAKTADPKFLLEKDIEIAVQKNFPEFTSRYVLVTHSLLPYHLCREVGVIHKEIMSELAANIESAEQVDLVLAAKLIKEKLTPFMEKNNMTPERCLFNSKYYEK
jgi:kynurenine 3-monooxygenase